MSTEENKAFVRRLYQTFDQVFRTGNFELFNEVIAIDFIDHNPTPGQGPGLEGIKPFFGAFRAAFPDLHFHVENQIAEGDQVVSRITLHGTHKGDFQGIPATGKPVMQEGIDIVRIANGKVVERWGLFDNLGLLQQLGAIPPPPG